MKKTYAKKFFARMNQEEADIIIQKCNENDEPVSALIRKLLRMWIKKNNTNNAK